MISERGARPIRMDLHDCSLVLAGTVRKVLDHSPRVADSMAVSGLGDQEMTDKHCILIVEDEPLVAEVVVDALSEAYRTIAVDAAVEALEQLRQGGIDLVLLDYLLPGGGASQVLTSADTAGVPVVIMSGDTERESEISACNHPFIAKPFRIEDLIRAIDAAIGRRVE
jgi:DNA-binding NtrC family response regulator